ncbi:hypothetical protein HNQ50_003275 [Silvimonas terrae]|uniref:Uncharacterized protein n=1 Tax=Silvimonas terrae TaxID=300266 RepID=A0A840RK53_9NEIS|nr:hypothetical protein [Silvimonas terrae]MBB5192531.1 hypothetical protein [Silvimonas terrae]
MLFLTFCLLISGIAPAQTPIASAHPVNVVQATDTCTHCHEAAPAPKAVHHATASPCCDNTFCSMTPAALLSAALASPPLSGKAIRHPVAMVVQINWLAAPPLPPPRPLA